MLKLRPKCLHFASANSFNANIALVRSSTDWAYFSNPLLPWETLFTSSKPTRYRYGALCWIKRSMLNPRCQWKAWTLYD